jgi:guanosine-3',5'-bis(diphosphate) 3'-pyrophosphohydrolase
MTQTMTIDEMGLVFKALQFAAQKHRDQRRKGPEAEPYINHPIALVHVLWHEAGVHDAVVLVAALLHDTIEDTDTTAEELEREFGAEICQVVCEVTDDKSLPKQERKQGQIDHAHGLSDRAKLVKLADKICNLRDLAASTPPDWSLQRQQEYFTWAKQVVDQMRGIHPRLEDLFDNAYRMGFG